MRLVWAEVDLSAIEQNIRQIRGILRPNTRIMSIIKANGYGHGAARVAKGALEEQTDYFGVAVLSEAVELRRKWITKPILIMGYTEYSDYEELISYDVMQTIFHRDQAEALDRAARRMGTVARVHIKVDTGMHRMGFADTPDSLEEIAAIAAMPNLQIDGVYSHMANADIGDMTYSQRQLTRFLGFQEALESRLVALNEAAGRRTKIPIKHIANSAAMVTMEESRLDMVRPGILLYGHYPSPYIAGCCRDLALRQAIALKARVVNIHPAPPGERVSYGGTFETARPTVIATLPLGYADGYPRVLSNRGSVLVRGQRAPVIGNVCMDHLMIDVTDIPGVARGDEVVLFGRSRDQEIDVSEIAGLTGSINYEILTGLSERVPRVYR